MTSTGSVGGTAMGHWVWVAGCGGAAVEGADCMSASLSGCVAMFGNVCQSQRGMCSLLRCCDVRAPLCQPLSASLRSSSALDACVVTPIRGSTKKRIWLQVELQVKQLANNPNKWSAHPPSSSRRPRPSPVSL